MGREGSSLACLGYKIVKWAVGCRTQVAGFSSDNKPSLVPGREGREALVRRQSHMMSDRLGRPRSRTPLEVSEESPVKVSGLEACAMHGTRRCCNDGLAGPHRSPSDLQLPPALAVPSPKERLWSRNDVAV